MPTTTSRRTPLWAIALAGVLQLTGGAKPRPDLSRADALRSGRGAHTKTPHLRNQQSGADRGRHADSPAEIPVQGWKDIAYRIYQGISEDRIIAISAGVTFFVLLALFPGIAGANFALWVVRG